MEQQLNNIKDNAKDAARNVKDAAKDSLRDVKSAGHEAVKEAKNVAEDSGWATKAHQLQDNIKSTLESGIDSVKGIKADDVKGYAADLGARAKNVGNDIYADPVGFVKRNPVTAAIGFAAVGFLVGTIIAKARSSEE